MAIIRSNHQPDKYLNINRNLVHFSLAVPHQNFKPIDSSGRLYGAHWDRNGQPGVIYRFPGGMAPRPPNAREFAILLHLLSLTRAVESQDGVVHEAQRRAARLAQRGKSARPRNSEEASRILRSLPRGKFKEIRPILQSWAPWRVPHLSNEDKALLTERTLIHRLRNDAQFAGFASLEFLSLGDACIACGLANAQTRSVRGIREAFDYWSNVGLEFSMWRQNGTVGPLLAFDPVITDLSVPEKGPARVWVKLNTELVQATHPSHGNYSEIALPLPYYSAPALNLWLYANTYQHATKSHRTIGDICRQVGLRPRNDWEAKARLQEAADTLSQKNDAGLMVEARFLSTGQVRFDLTDPNRPPEFDE